MEINRYEIPFKSKGEKFYIIPLGDIHLCSKNCAKDKLQNILDYIKDTPNVYWLGVGDYAECIMHTDKRFDPENIDPEYLACLGRIAQEATADLIKYFKPIKNRCIGLHDGTHEIKIKREHSIDLTYELCKALGTAYLGFSAFTRLVFIRYGKQYSFDIFSTHSKIAGRKGGNKINRLEDMVTSFDADIIFIAHGHRKTVTTISQLRLTRTLPYRIVTRKVVAGMTGSFYRAYAEGTSSYAEQAGYPPSDLGVIKVIIEPYSGNLHLSE